MNSQAQSKSSKYTVVGRGQGELGSRALREFPEVGAPLKSLDVPCVRARAWGPNTFWELKDSWLGNRVERLWWRKKGQLPMASHRQVQSLSPLTAGDTVPGVKQGHPSVC